MVPDFVVKNSSWLAEDRNYHDGTQVNSLESPDEKPQEHVRTTAADVNCKGEKLCETKLGCNIIEDCFK